MKEKNNFEQNEIENDNNDTLMEGEGHSHHSHHGSHSSHHKNSKDKNKSLFNKIQNWFDKKISRKAMKVQ